MDARHRIRLLSLVILALFAGGLYLYHYVPDDTFITLRYARNLARGDGLVFNEGVRLEGYTNFLWLIMLAAAAKIGLPLLGTARALSGLFSLAVLWLTYSLARETARRANLAGWDEGLAAALPPMLLAASAPFPVWSLSGTEMPLYTALLLFGFKLVRDRGPALSVFAVFALLGLVRPDGLLFYLLAWFLLLRRGAEPDGDARTGRRRGIILRGAFVLLILFGPYLIWKRLYFGSLLPNTFYAKTGPPGLMLSNGAAYVGAFIASYGYLVALGMLLMKRLFPRGGTAGLTLPFVLAHWAAALILGGDWMPHFRLLLPTLPLVLLFANEGLVAAVSEQREKQAVGGKPAEAGGKPAEASEKPAEASGKPAEAGRGSPLPIVALALVLFVMFPGGLRYERFENERFAVHIFSRLGRSLRLMLPPDTSIGLGSTGAIGYYTDMEIVDILGLTEAHIARRGRIVATQPGHMKTDGAYVLSREPDLLLLGNVQVHRGRRSADEMTLKVQERDIADQPAFARDYEFVEIPLGSDYYLSCFKRNEYFLPVGD